MTQSCFVCAVRSSSIVLGILPYLYAEGREPSGQRSSGNVRLLKDTEALVAGRDVVIVEDIVDSGNSLCRLIGLFKERGAASVKVCAFLDKKARRVAPVEADYVGYEVEDAFVVGYGLDYAEKYRNLPYIGVLKESVYKK